MCIAGSTTSQDIFDTAAMMVAQRAVRLIRADLARTAEALADLAVAHRDTVMAGRTLALHAVPTTFGLKAAGWRKLVLDAERRLALVESDGLPVSLGGAAGTLAGYLEYARIDTAAGEAAPDAEAYAASRVEAFAEETGLACHGLPWHALRTPIADLAAALAFTTGALGKIATEVQTWPEPRSGRSPSPPPPPGAAALRPCRTSAIRYWRRSFAVPPSKCPRWQAL